MIVVCGRLRRVISRRCRRAGSGCRGWRRLRPSCPRCRGIDPCVVDDEIHGAVAIVALRADDEAGDQGGRDDGDNDESGEAGGHCDLRNGEGRAVKGAAHFTPKPMSPAGLIRSAGRGRGAAGVLQCGAHALRDSGIRRGGRLLRRPAGAGRPRRDFVARGAHLAAIRERGLEVRSPVLGDFIVRAAAEEDSSRIGFVDVVVLP